MGKFFKQLKETEKGVEALEAEAGKSFKEIETSKRMVKSYAENLERIRGRKGLDTQGEEKLLELMNAANNSIKNKRLKIFGSN